MQSFPFLTIPHADALLGTFSSVEPIAKETATARTMYPTILRDYTPEEAAFGYRVVVNENSRFDFCPSVKHGPTSSCKCSTSEQARSDRLPKSGSATGKKRKFSLLVGEKLAALFNDIQTLVAGWERGIYSKDDTFRRLRGMFRVVRNNKGANTKYVDIQWRPSTQQKITYDTLRHTKENVLIDKEEVDKSVGRYLCFRTFISSWKRTIDRKLRHENDQQNLFREVFVNHCHFEKLLGVIAEEAAAAPIRSENQELFYARINGDLVNNQRKTNACLMAFYR